MAATKLTDKNNRDASAVDQHIPSYFTNFNRQLTWQTVADLHGRLRCDEISSAEITDDVGTRKVSQAVAQLSTNWALRYFTLEFGWDPVF